MVGSMHSHWRLPVRWAYGVLVTALFLAVADSGLAQDGPAAGWEQLPGPAGPITRLFAPTSGALLAQAGNDLHRSDDGGDIWRAVPLPPTNGPAARVVNVNSADHTTLFTSGADGLYRTTDDAATWSLIRPRNPGFATILAVAASPVDRGLVYLAASSSDGKVIQFSRSRDGGTSWEDVEQNGHSFLSCRWTVSLLRFDAADPNRLYRAASCPRSGGPLASLQERMDLGSTWSVLAELGGVPPESIKDPRTTRGGPAPTPVPAPAGRVEPTASGEPVTGNPEYLVGGAGANPARLYLAVNKDARGGGSSLLRSDDQGRTWREVLGFVGGGSATPADDPRPDVRIGGLAASPSEPDRVYVALNERAKGQPAATTVRVSVDGGASWSEPAPSTGLGQVRDLALGIDGANLYAAGDQGVWRLRLR